MKRPVRNVSSAVKTFSCLFSYPKPRNLKNDECLSRSSIDSVTACKPERRFSKDREDLQLHRCSSKGFSFARNVSNVSKRESSWYEASFIPDSKVFPFHRLNKSHSIDGRWLGKICLRFLPLRVLVCIVVYVVCDVYYIQYFFVVVKNLLYFDYRCYKVDKQVSIIFLIATLTVFEFFVRRKRTEKIRCVCSYFIYHTSLLVFAFTFQFYVLAMYTVGSSICLIYRYSHVL